MIQKPQFKDGGDIVRIQSQDFLINADQFALLAVVFVNAEQFEARFDQLGRLLQCC
jgi:hypothetical protein